MTERIRCECGHRPSVHNLRDNIRVAGAQGGEYPCNSCNCPAYAEAANPLDAEAAAVVRSRHEPPPPPMPLPPPSTVGPPPVACPRCEGKLLREPTADVDGPDEFTCVNCGYVHYPPGYREAQERAARVLDLPPGRQRRREPSFNGMQL